jgi:YggT family protein
MHLYAFRARHIIAYILGGLIALLLARLILRLFAARPDNPIVGAVLAITTPPRLLAALDAGQPRFGAVLEFSTLALIAVLLLAGLLLRRIWQRQLRGESKAR